MTDLEELLDRLKKKTAGDDKKAVEALKRVFERRPDLRKQLNAADVAWIEARVNLHCLTPLCHD